jgi:hypothetical protein
VDRVWHDYGIDLYVYAHGEDGGIENGNILVQAKATDRLRVLADQRTISVRVAHGGPGGAGRPVRGATLRRGGG